MSDVLMAMGKSASTRRMRERWISAVTRSGGAYRSGSSCLHRRCRGRRQIQFGPRAGAWLARQPERSLKLDRQAMDHGQPEPCALFSS